MARSMGGHELAREGETNDWLTPPHIIKALGPFDLDPCSTLNRPWDTAERHYTIHDDGLSQPWSGFVWCNPPYGPHVWTWLSRLADHGNGIALIFARTETQGFFEQVWMRASSLLFLEGRLRFHRPDGSLPGTSNAGAPSVLVGYGKLATARLRTSVLQGTYMNSWSVLR